MVEILNTLGKPLQKTFIQARISPDASSDATIYAECRCDERGVIYISYDYYILDYYDWGPGQADLYSLNTFNYACNFINVGQLHGDMTTVCRD